MLIVFHTSEEWTELLAMNGFVENLMSDLDYPLEYQRLFENIRGAEELAQILTNKDSFVRDKIGSCKEILKSGDLRYLIREGFFEKRNIGEIVVKKTFALEGSFQGYGLIVRGPAAFERGVVIGRSTIVGPVYVSEKSMVFDSILRGGSNGSVYIGRNCSLWDYTVIIRSLIGDGSLIHTCNIDDSIVGPDSNFGATNMMSGRASHKIRPRSEDHAKLDDRIVLANYSYGAKIRVLDPTTDAVLQTAADHFGTLSGTGVWLASGAIVYPGTIIGSAVKINSTVPLIGYIPPERKYSLFLSIKKDKKGEKAIQLRERRD